MTSFSCAEGDVDAVFGNRLVSLLHILFVLSNGGILVEKITGRG